MNRIKVLDCTLRDGGYCNQWKFGYHNIQKIIDRLTEAELDIIECGFLSEKVQYDKNVTKFATVEEISEFLPQRREGKLFVAMVNYGEYDAGKLPVRSEGQIDGIRVAFHKKDLEGALELCRAIGQKGYQVFVQPMVSVSYTDEEFLYLIRLVNEVRPYAFYIVDSFGMMKEKELIRFFYMVEHNLETDIWVGFHSHNNMQLAYSNAQKLATVHTKRDLIIDTSVYGMGRGAGNLNTELFVEFLNENTGASYELKPLLGIIDEIINEFYQRNYWGYSLPNYLSAKHNAHPNYARYLDDQKTLTVEDMESIFDMMDQEKRFKYDAAYIEQLYLRYMNMGDVQNEHEKELETKLKNKRILLIAPGKSATDESEAIRKFAGDEETLCISVNFDYTYVDTDFVFVSNLRRYRELDRNVHGKCIVTSNISAVDVYLQTKYKNLVNCEESVKDKAGLMAIRFLMDYGAKEIWLAGFDGYSHDIRENYGEKDLAFFTRNAVLDAMNEGMCRIMRQYAKDAAIHFLTKPKYITI